MLDAIPYLFRINDSDPSARSSCWVNTRPIKMGYSLTLNIFWLINHDI